MSLLFADLLISSSKVGFTVKDCTWLKLLLIGYISVFVQVQIEL